MLIRSSFCMADLCLSLSLFGRWVCGAIAQESWKAQKGTPLISSTGAAFSGICEETETEKKKHLTTLNI